MEYHPLASKVIKKFVF